MKRFGGKGVIFLRKIIQCLDSNSEYNTYLVIPTEAGLKVYWKVESKDGTFSLILVVKNQ